MDEAYEAYEQLRYAREAWKLEQERLMLQVGQRRELRIELEGLRKKFPMRVDLLDCLKDQIDEDVRIADEAIAEMEASLGKSNAVRTVGSPY
jgi:hypothetical protein